MTSANTNYFIQANLTLVSNSDYSTTTIKLVNRPKLSDTNEEWFPILKDISKIGTVSDDVMVLPSSGNVTIIDDIGSFGVERKFSDILQRYSIIDQPISLYYAVTNSTDEDPSLTLFAKARILEWQIDYQSNRQFVRLNFTNRIFSKKYITKQLNSTEFAALPGGNLSGGGGVPVVFGTSVEVPVFDMFDLVIASTATTGQATNDNPQYDTNGYSVNYGYATTFGTTFVNGGVQKYYAKSYRGDKYYEVGSVTSHKTAYATTGITSGGSSARVLAAQEIAFRLDVRSTPFMLTMARFWFHNQGVGALTPAGDIICSIYDSDISESGLSLNRPMERPFAQSTVKKSDYYGYLNAAYGGGEYWIEFYFDKPIPLYKPFSYYWVSIQLSQYTGSTTTDFILGNITTGAMTGHIRSKGDFWEGDSGTINPGYRAEFFGMKFTDNPAAPNYSGFTNVSTQTGLGCSYVEGICFVNGTNGNVSANRSPDITKLDIIVSVNGLLDDSSGTITGSASSQILYIHDAINLLEREWSGSAWVATGNWDFTAYSAGQAAIESIGSLGYKIIEGSTNGMTTFEQFCLDACHDHASKIIMRNDGKLAVYSWGGTYSSSGVLNQENSKVTALRMVDSSYVLNRINFAYSKILRNTSTVNIVQQGPIKNYLSSLFLYTGVDSDITSYVGGSESIYGKKYLADTTIEWLSDSTSARNLAIYYLINYNKPPQFVQIEASFLDFVSINPYSILTIVHPALPAYYGTSPNTLSPYYSGDSVDVTLGYTMTRAEGYRAQLYERYVDFAENGEPKLIFVLRLLTNSKDPT